MTSFKQSVIIPLEDYKKYKDFTSKLNQVPSNKILFDETLPADVKMKLFKKQKIKDQRLQKIQSKIDATAKATITDLKTKSSSGMQTSSLTKSTASVQTVPSLPYIDKGDFQEEHRKTVNLILDTIAANVSELSYNKDYEILIDRRLLPGSNIKEILKYIMNTSIITRSDDIPLGALHFYEKLIKLGFPKDLLKIKPSNYGAAQKIITEAKYFVTPKSRFGPPQSRSTLRRSWIPYGSPPLRTRFNSLTPRFETHSSSTLAHINHPPRQTSKDIPIQYPEYGET